MLRLVPCGCGADCLVRIERAWWMRLFAWRRLYFCTKCRSRLLIRKPPLAPPGSVGAVPLPPAARDGEQPLPMASANGAGSPRG